MTPVAEVRRFKDSDGRDIMLSGTISSRTRCSRVSSYTRSGCSSTPPSWAAMGLVVEGTSFPCLKLLESRAFGSGVALLRYAVTTAELPGNHTIDAVSGHRTRL